MRVIIGKRLFVLLIILSLFSNAVGQDNMNNA